MHNISSPLCYSPLLTPHLIIAIVPPAVNPTSAVHSARMHKARRYRRPQCRGLCTLPDWRQHPIWVDQSAFPREFETARGATHARDLVVECKVVARLVLPACGFTLIYRLGPRELAPSRGVKGPRTVPSHVVQDESERWAILAHTFLELVTRARRVVAVEVDWSLQISNILNFVLVF